MRWTALWADLRRDCSLLAAEESGLYVGRSSWWWWWSTSSSSSSTKLQDCVDGGEVAAAANDDDAEILEDLFCIFGFRERERELKPRGFFASLSCYIARYQLFLLLENDFRGYHAPTSLENTIKVNDVKVKQQ